MPFSSPLPCRRVDLLGQQLHEAPGTAFPLFIENTCTNVSPGDRFHTAPGR
jgi:hypothetical protein